MLWEAQQPGAASTPLALQKRAGGGHYPFPSNNPTPISLVWKSEPEVGYFASTTQPRVVAVAVAASPPPRGVVSITGSPRLALLPAPNATSLALKSESEVARLSLW
ncbi:hypothetical protein CVT26_008980 [Gymnopilus dilepis]|uniref:Uncharacterized protein n=1 Tax=Gymnopilus dilepis TaxID=231916 RepID=A0A409YB56_9AGAR|nr:hypothetical protein CVT26_008980 [Gymnopilus dilepis]